MNGFLQQSPGLPGVVLDHGPLGQVRIDSPSHGIHLRARPASPAWADQSLPMDAALGMPSGSQFSADEFAKFRQLTRASPSPSAAASSASQLGTQRPMIGVGMMNAGMGLGMVSRPMFQPMYSQPQYLQQEPEGKGKARMVELDDNIWEEQFAQMELEDRQAKEEDESLAMEPELGQMDDALLDGETGFGDFESIWNGINATNTDMRGDIQREWDTFDDWDGGGRSIQLQPVQEYAFEEENIYRDHANPFEEGVRIMTEGGNLSLAALAFEAACQKNAEHVEAWVYLGSAQAQNEKEDPAIRAMEHALRIDPSNLSALMGLAVSYTNEGYEIRSYQTLERWLSVKYPSIIPPDQLSSPAEVGFTNRQQLHERITNAFIRAAQMSPDGQHMDPDVQVGLGVLFYGSEEFDKAVDCFTAALHSTESGTSNQRSQVHLLWNRLGATLANSGRSEDAIHAYETALSIRPNFVRARYNLGVGCINMGCHQEAASHLLAALAMHREVETSGRERAREILGGSGDVSDEHLDRIISQNRSTTLYDTLRRTFTQMRRRDLAEKVVVGMDPEIFRSEFDF